MSKLNQIKKIGILLSFFLLAPLLAKAYQDKVSGETPRLWSAKSHLEADIAKPLSKAQQKSMARQLVAKVLSNRLFRKSELPQKMSLAAFRYEGAQKFDNKEFTNIVLNQFLQSSHVMIQNQDLRTDLSMDYSLMRYENGERARYTAALLGANYLITGNVKNQNQANEKGKIEALYNLEMTVQDVHTRKVVIQEKLTYKKGSLKRLFSK